MKAMTKIALVSASVLTMGALTACQSTTAPNKDGHGSEMMRGHHQHDRQMTPEQREQKKQMRAEHKEMRKQIRKACDGKTAGQAVQVKAGNNTVDGTCNMVFKADHKAMAEMKGDFRNDQGRMMHGGQRMKDMTEEQRAQVKQQFEQKRAERKAQWDAIQSACAGQANDKAIQVKIGEKLIDGQCKIKFKPNQPMNDLRRPAPMQTTDAPAAP